MSLNSEPYRSQIKELESQLDFYKHHFPGVRDLAREHRPPQVNTSVSEDRANGGRVPTPGNPLPSPPRPIWYPFTARNPNFVPPGNSQEPYLRTNVPPIHAQPYVYQRVPSTMKAHDMKIAWCPRPFVTWPQETPVLNESEREVDPGTGSANAAPKGEVADGKEKANETGKDESETGTDAIQDATTKAWPSALLPSGDNRPWEMLSVFTRGHIIPARGFTPQQYLPSLRPLAESIATHIRAPLVVVEHHPPDTGTAPAIVTTVSVSGSRHREVPLSAGPEPSRAARTDHNTRWADPVSRPSSTPTGPLLSSWAPSQNDGGPNLRAFPAGSTSMGLTARNSVSSWGTEDSGPTQGDLFSTLRPLAPAPADGGPPASDLLPRSDGQLLGVGRSNQIANPRPQLAHASTQPLFVGHPDRDADTRPRSRHSHHSRSRTISGSQASVVSSAPQPFGPEDRGFPYAAVPPPPSVPFPYSTARSSAGTPASRPPSHPVSAIPPFPYIPAPQPTTAVSRMPQYTQQPFIYGSSSSLSQNSSHRSHH
ncbi:hypothetical protein H4582DRAFT_2073544 [Lactarius indigo]|nr:hypothetical protein H4582DRAFT_2073544 [Lactarius indigo]